MSETGIPKTNTSVTIPIPIEIIIAPATPSILISGTAIIVPIAPPPIFCDPSL